VVCVLRSLRTVALAGAAADISSVNVEKIQCPRKRMIAHLFDRFWLGVECRQRRIDDPPRFGHGSHAANVTNMKGRLAQHENKPTAFLQNDGCRAREQVRRNSWCDFGHPLDRAWGDDQPSRW